MNDHQRESGIVTYDELEVAKEWIEAVTPLPDGQLREDRWHDDWLDTGLPFEFTYGGESISDMLPKWEFRTAEDRTANETPMNFEWADPASGLTTVWEVTPIEGYPAVDWILWLKNEGKEDTSLISDLQSLDVELKNGDITEPFVIHGANGGRSEQDDFFPFSRELPSPETPGMGDAHHLQLGG